MRYLLKADHEQDWREVDKTTWIKAERAAGFRPPISSDDPRYMTICATGGFYGHGVAGKIESK